MPLKRTPPKDSSQDSTVPSKNHNSATSDESDLGQLTDSSNKVTNRSHKRRAVGSPQVDKQNQSMDTFMSEMRTLFKGLALQQEKRFEELKVAMEEQTSDIKESISFLSAKYDTIMSDMATLKDERKEDKKHIEELERKVEQLEKRVRSTSLEIRNIPFMEGESKLDLINTFVNMSQTLQVPLQQSEIKDIFRINTKNSGRVIIAELTTVISKDKVLEGYKVYNKSHNKLNTKALNIPGPETVIYLSESLTSYSNKLFFSARKFKAEHNYKFCWAHNGIIYLRKEEGSPKIRINYEKDLISLAQKE